jgi:hypothetical protein
MLYGVFGLEPQRFDVRAKESNVFSESWCWILFLTGVLEALRTIPNRLHGSTAYSSTPVLFVTVTVLFVCWVLHAGNEWRLPSGALMFFLLVTRGGVTLLAGHTHQPDESDCGGLQHCCH